MHRRRPGSLRPTLPCADISALSCCHPSRVICSQVFSVYACLMRLRILVSLLAALAFAAGLVLALDAFWWEPSSLRLTRYEVALDAPALKGLKIAVISDLHAGAPYITEQK